MTRCSSLISAMSWYLALKRCSGWRKISAILYCCANWSSVALYRFKSPKRTTSGGSLLMHMRKKTSFSTDSSFFRSTTLTILQVRCTVSRREHKVLPYQRSTTAPPHRTVGLAPADRTYVSKLAQICWPTGGRRHRPTASKAVKAQVTVCV